MASYVTSASNAIMDLANMAATAAVGAANSAHATVLSYKYQEVANDGAASDFPNTDEPVWLLGVQYSAKYDLDELRDAVRSRLWFTYRRDFPVIGSSGISSDQGWGCMLRCGQMVVGSALLNLQLGRGWSWSPDSVDPRYLKVVQMFQDLKSAPYSIHQISLMGESVDRKPIGTWFGPNTVAQAIRKLAHYDQWNNLAVYVALDNTLVRDEVREAATRNDKALDNINNDKQSQQPNCDHPSEPVSDFTTETSSNPEDAPEPDRTWRPLLLFIPLRLGLSEINPVYIKGLKACFTFDQTLGVIGGSPNHALYMLGYVGEEIVYLDPHVTQMNAPVSDWCEKRTDEEMTAGASYHSSRAHRINIQHLDPSLSLCFLCKTEAEFDDLCLGFQAKLIDGEKTPLFEICAERPAHMIGLEPSRDLNIVPDGATGTDYEQIRNYDSEDEFEIL